MKRVVVTGMAGISPLGNDWDSARAGLLSGRNAVQRIEDWAQYQGLNTQLGAPAKPLELPAHYNRKTMRGMGRVAVLAVRSAEMALADAGLSEDPIVKNGEMGIAYGSSAGSPSALGEFGRLVADKSTASITATTYVRMMSHTAAVNIGVFLGVTGRINTTCSACTSGSQSIGEAFEIIRHGRQTAMIAGGSEELDASGAAVFDTLFATSVSNDTPEATPRPFDADRDGLVLGEGAGTLILEEYEHAKARGATIYAEILGYGTNSDGRHVTSPSSETMRIAMQQGLDHAGIPASAVGYVNAHGTATKQGDIAETQASAAVYGPNMPISSLKSYMGHTLGACGTLEAWMSIAMMREGWFAPTANLKNIDPACGELDYIVDGARKLDCEHIVSNNFAFGGINTSLVFGRG